MSLDVLDRFDEIADIAGELLTAGNVRDLVKAIQHIQ